MEVKVRDLNVDDVFTVSEMFAKVTKAAREDLAVAFAGSTKKSKENVNLTDLGMALFQVFFTEAKDDLKSWLADISGYEVADFGKMPAMTLLDIAEQVLAHEDIQAFFTRALSLVDKVPVG